MKDRPLIYLALVLSLTALGYAIWVHRQADSIAEAALQRREARFVDALTPKVQRAYTAMGITNRLDHPTRLEQLFGPYLDRMNEMVGGDTNR
ncbi:hypothetical protein GC207_08330 [bacterium]|nr:hypothetical protein [bacterium]